MGGEIKHGPTLSTLRQPVSKQLSTSILLLLAIAHLDYLQEFPIHFQAVATQSRRANTEPFLCIAIR